MDYPQTIPAFLAAARAWQPPADISEAYYAGVFAGSPVSACTEALRLLKDRTDLDAGGLKVLLGAAYLIALPNNQWHGLGGVAAQVLAQRASELPVEPDAQ